MRDRIPSLVLFSGILISIVGEAESIRARYRSSRYGTTGGSSEYGWVAGAVVGGVFVIAVIIFIAIRCYHAKKQGVSCLKLKTSKIASQPSTDVKPTQSGGVGISQSPYHGQNSHHPNWIDAPPDYSQACNYPNGPSTALQPPGYSLSEPPGYSTSDPVYPPGPAQY